MTQNPPEEALYSAPERTPARASVPQAVTHLVLDGGYPDGTWKCAGCTAHLEDGALAHDAGCTETGRIAAAERERCKRGVTQCCGSENYQRDRSPGARDGWRCGTCGQGTGLIGGIV